MNPAIMTDVHVASAEIDPDLKLSAYFASAHIEWYTRQTDEVYMGASGTVVVPYLKLA